MTVWRPQFDREFDARVSGPTIVVHRDRTPASAISVVALTPNDPKAFAPPFAPAYAVSLLSECRGLFFFSPARHAASEEGQDS